MSYQMDDLQKRMGDLSDEALIMIVKYDYNDYTDDALQAAKEELSKRNIQVSTYEGVEKEVIAQKDRRYAGFWLRLGAYFIDSIILNLMILLIFAINAGIIFGVGKLLRVEVVEGSVVEVIGGIINFIMIIAGVWLYHAFLESSTWQATVGKMVVGIIVTDTEGKRITFGKASARYWGKIVSGLILSIGYIMAGFTQKKQALHDILANCLVIKK